jgi:hypothetical protein
MEIRRLRITNGWEAYEFDAETVFGSDGDPLIDTGERILSNLAKRSDGFIIWCVRTQHARCVRVTTRFTVYTSRRYQFLHPKPLGAKKPAKKPKKVRNTHTHTKPKRKQEQQNHTPQG